MVEVLILWQGFVEQTHTPRKPQRKGAKSLYLFLVSLAVHLTSLASIGEDEKTEAKKKQKTKTHPTVTSLFVYQSELRNGLPLHFVHGILSARPA